MDLTVDRSRVVPLLRRGFSVALIASLAFVTGLFISNTVGYTDSFVVLSTSMTPLLQPGDLIVVRPVSPSAVQVGDVITYRATGDVGGAGTDRITHRVIEKRQTDGGAIYRMQGDASGAPDASQVPHSRVIGELWFYVPLVGHFILFAMRPLGQFLFVAMPGLLLLGLGIRTLYQNIQVG